VPFIVKVAKTGARDWLMFNEQEKNVDDDVEAQRGRMNPDSVTLVWVTLWKWFTHHFAG